MKFTSGISSIELGLCPKCNDHTEFVDLVYKVCHEYGGDLVTTNYKEAKQQFENYKKDSCDNVRLYEGLATSFDPDEIDWDLLACHVREEEIVEI